MYYFLLKLSNYSCYYSVRFMFNVYYLHGFSQHNDTYNGLDNHKNYYFYLSVSDIVCIN